MNLTLNTRWSKNDRRTYLIVTVSADDTTEASASQTYLDINLPEDARIRHIGNLSTNGHGNSIGVDLPDLAAGQHQNIVFKVRSRQERDDAIEPELHLHWIDSASGDLLERHQTGTPMPTESTEANDHLSEIVAAARSTHTRTNRRGRAAIHQEIESMTTEHTQHNRRPHRCNRRHENREAFMAGREIGRRGRHAARYERHGMSPRKRAMMLQIREMQDRIEEMEQRIARLQGKASFRGMPRGARFEERETHRDITRSRREGRPGRSRRGHRCGHHMHGEGRKMGRMMRRAAASHYAHDERQLDA